MIRTESVAAAVPPADSSPGQPSRGLTVADLSVTGPGPYCTSLLARLGARVIKFEPPDGDPARVFPAAYDALNRGKESVVVDLTDLDDRELLRAVVARADVVVEGWRPAVADRLGIGFSDAQALNSRIVYCSVSGYGAQGDLRDRPSHDINCMAVSGAIPALFPDGPPGVLGLPLADLFGGTFAALRILGAVLSAREHGAAAFIDVSLAGAIRDALESFGGAGTRDALAAVFELPHYGYFRLADGEYLSLGIVQEDHLWRNLCAALGRPDWADLDFEARVNHRSLRADIELLLGRLTRPEIETMFDGVDTCWSLVESYESWPGVSGRVPAAPPNVSRLGADTHAVRSEFVVR